MKIIHILAPARAGGLERVVHALAIGQQRRGHHVIAVPVAEELANDHPFRIPLERAGVEILPIVVPARSYRRERTLVAELLQRIRPDVMHSHGYHTDVMSVGIARRENVASVSTAHGFTRGEWKNLVYEWLDRRAFRRFDGVACVSRLLADELVKSGVPKDKVRVIPNAWSQVAQPLTRAAAREALGIPQQRRVVGWVGRMTREKGLDVLIDAIARLANADVHFCIVGDGPERATQVARAELLGLNDRITWTGMLLEASTFFPAFDVLALSSRTEGVPMVVLEAMAQRIPLVATAVGGIPDVISSNEAMLVQSEDSVMLASAITELIENPLAAGERAAAASVRLASKFDENAWLNAYDALYTSAITRHR